MNTELTAYIAKARAKGLADTTIRANLTAAGWTGQEVEAALGDDLPVPQPPKNRSKATSAQVTRPAAARGVEYMLYGVTLVLSVAALVLIANVAFRGEDMWTFSAFALTLLAAAGPIALLLFMRLRGAETIQPALRQDQTRRRILQLVQLAAFLTIIGHTVILVYMLIAGYYSAGGPSSYDYYGSAYDRPNLLFAVLRWLATLIIAGGVFVYYWREEHRNG